MKFVFYLISNHIFVFINYKDIFNLIIIDVHKKLRSLRMKNSPKVQIENRNLGTRVAYLAPVHYFQKARGGSSGFPICMYTVMLLLEDRFSTTW